MKHAKKIASLLLALVMVFSLAVTVFAGAEDPAAAGNTITVENAQKGETYAIYRMLDLSVSANRDAFAYTVNEHWTSFFTGSGAGVDYVNIDEMGYVTWKENMDTAEKMIAFGKAAAVYATTASNNVPTAKESQTPTAEGDITFTQLDPGYYLITSTNGTKVIVDTTPTNPNPSIVEKNDDPTITKQVQEDSKEGDANQGWGVANDADMGQDVNFKITVHAKPGAKNYVVHDKMANGLTLKAGTIAVASAAKGTDYTVNENPSCSHKEAGSEDTYNCTFTITFKQNYLDRITADTDIVITYTATLNQSANVGGAGNENKTKLNWGDASETLWYETKTYTWEVDVFKYTMKGETPAETALADATFKLSTDQTGNEVIKFSKAVDSESAVIPNTYKVDPTGEVTTFTTPANGKIYFQGLDEGTYYLTETEAPAGYNMLADSIKVVITSAVGETDATSMTGSVAYCNYDATTNTYPAEATPADDNLIKVENKTGTELPSTGGVGTTIFYVLGGLLAAGAAVLLVTKKRMSAEK